MDVSELLAAATDRMGVRRVFGEPVEVGDEVIIPVAWVAGGAGGGGGQDSAEGPSGSGGGSGFVARPVGVYRIRGGDVSWHPAVDVNAMALGGQVLAAVGLLVLGLRRRRG